MQDAEAFIFINSAPFVSLILDQHVLTNAGLYGGFQFLAEHPAVNLVGYFFYHTFSILNVLTTNSV